MFSNLISQPLSLPIRKMEPVSNHNSDPVSDNHLLPTKRKAALEVSSDNPLPQQLPKKRTVQIEPYVNSPRMSPLSPLNKKQTQLHSMNNSQGPLKRTMMRNDSMSNKTASPRVQTPKTKTAPLEVSPKVRNESYETVRSKMRETLAAALSVGNPNKEEVSNEDKSAPSRTLVDDKQEASGMPATETNPETKTQNTDEQKPQYNYVIPDTDGSFSDTFFVKDDLLQGNGLSWAWDMDETEPKEAQADEKPNPIPTDVNEKVKSPQELAFKIESELFKLFGGVNKKYKERGRSLMFNLKDTNNPELREKVLYNKISPERLCSMTPEELASKELSEWRMAKAEEHDKMIVLPDSDGDMRRLVKKTHKGEYQVEVEHEDDGVSVEVAVGSDSLTHFQPRKKKVVAEGEKSGLGKPETTGGITVSTDGSDMMQELIVDEFKDEGFLPPIVSLDEFMESLDSEPPFENLPVDADKETKAVNNLENEKKSSLPVSANDHVEAEVQTNKALNVKHVEERKISPPVSEYIGERLWEGDLQLTLSSAVSVIGLFRSGEKTTTKEWPISMEIKGRVRLQAFEKFLKELPMSRSRAVMVVHFVLKEASSEYHQACLSEAVDSYVAEERVGFGEPIPGVEVYFCPPNKTMTETLTRLLSKDQTDIIKSTDNGLTGVVVWRRPHPSSTTMLPNNASSHHKHHKKHLSSRRLDHINNSNTNSKSVRFQPDNNVGGHDNNNNDDDDDDDVPPGFGPGVAAQDVDDLPEFSFSGGSNASGQTLPAQTVSSIPPRPVAHMRQLVYEYGQTGNNTSNSVGANRNGNKHWNRDDDDIPEWQPHIQNHHQQQIPNHNMQELSRVNLVNQVRAVIGQTAIPIMPMQQPPNLTQNGWVQPPPPPPLPFPPGLPPNAAIQGQQYGGQWRPDDLTRGRGF